MNERFALMDTSHVRSKQWDQEFSFIQEEEPF